MSFISRFTDRIKNVFSSQATIVLRPRPTTPSLPINLGASITYPMNDLSTPGLLKEMSAGMYPSTPQFFIKDYQGGGCSLGTSGSHAANCYITITETLNLYNRLSTKPINRWAGTSVLRILPEAGVDLNAFYDRASLQFFFYGRKEIGGTIYAADSADVVAHELGHAILDFFMPKAFSAASMEVWAFHEAFADFTSMMKCLVHDEMIARILSETGGDLQKPSVLSNLAEHFGRALYLLTGDPHRNPAYLRTAINNFKYVSPASLPQDAPADQIAAEPHSFGRIFLGAFYDMLVAIYENRKAAGQTPENALQQARDAMVARVLTLVQTVPINTKFFETAAKGLLWVETVYHQKQYYDIIYKILANRNLMSPTIKILSDVECPNDKKILSVPMMLQLKLSDHVLQAQNNNPLYNVEVEIPQGQVMFFDNDGRMMDGVTVTNGEAIQAAQTMVEFLNGTGRVSDDPKTPFEIRDGKLVRSHFS